MKIVAAFLALTLLALSADGICITGSLDCLSKATSLSAAVVTQDGLCTKYAVLYACYIFEGCGFADATESSNAACLGQCGGCSAGANVKMSVLALSVSVLIAYLHL